jgi:hypothetical protein
VDQFTGIRPHSHWNAFEISSTIATLLLALGTFWMAFSTRRLAKSSEEQGKIASMSEFAARQPVVIPVDPGEYRGYITPKGAKWDDWWGSKLASYCLLEGDNISIRLVLRNVGRGVVALPADREAPEILYMIGRGVQAKATPSSRAIAPDEIFEVSYKGPVRSSAVISAAPWPTGDIPAVRLKLVYTDLTESMEMRCDVWYRKSEGNELRAFKTTHTSPYPVRSPSPVTLFEITLPE